MQVFLVIFSIRSGHAVFLNYWTILKICVSLKVENMNIPYCLESDNDDDLDCEPLGCIFLAKQDTFVLAEILCTFLNSTEGQNLLDTLHRLGKEIVLFEIKSETKETNLIQLVLKGDGLSSRCYFKDDSVVTEQASCLFTCYIGRFANKKIFSEEKLINSLKKEFQKIAKIPN